MARARRSLKIAGGNPSTKTGAATIKIAPVVDQQYVDRMIEALNRGPQALGEEIQLIAEENIRAFQQLDKNAQARTENQFKDLGNKLQSVARNTAKAFKAAGGDAAAKFAEGFRDSRATEDLISVAFRGAAQKAGAPGAARGDRAARTNLDALTDFLGDPNIRGLDLDVSRVFQDLNYGIVGIANNLPSLITRLSNARGSFNSVGETVGFLTGALKNNLLVWTGIGTFLLTFFFSNSGIGRKVRDMFWEWKEGTDELSASIEQLQEGLRTGLTGALSGAAKDIRTQEKQVEAMRAAYASSAGEVELLRKNLLNLQRARSGDVSREQLAAVRERLRWAEAEKDGLKELIPIQEENTAKLRGQMAAARETARAQGALSDAYAEQSEVLKEVNKEYEKATAKTAEESRAGELKALEDWRRDKEKELEADRKAGIISKQTETEALEKLETTYRENTRRINEEWDEKDRKADERARREREANAKKAQAEAERREREFTKRKQEEFTALKEEAELRIKNEDKVRKAEYKAEMDRRKDWAKRQDRIKNEETARLKAVEKLREAERKLRAIQAGRDMPDTSRLTTDDQIEKAREIALAMNAARVRLEEENARAAGLMASLQAKTEEERIAAIETGSVNAQIAFEEGRQAELEINEEFNNKLLDQSLKYKDMLDGVYNGPDGIAGVFAVFWRKRAEEMERGSKEQLQALADDEERLRQIAAAQQTATNMLSAFSNMASAQFDAWEARRRKELAAEGKTRREANEIIAKEGEKRIGIMTKLAQAEAVVNSGLAAVSMFSQVIRLSFLGPAALPLAIAAAGATFAAGIAQARLIGASAGDTVYAQGTSNVRLTGSGSGLGVQQTASAGKTSSATTADASTSPSKASQPAFIQAAAVAQPQTVEVVLSDQVMGSMVKRGNRYIARTTR